MKPQYQRSQNMAKRSWIRRTLIILVFLIFGVAATLFGCNRIVPVFFRPMETREAAGLAAEDTEIEVFSSSLEIPWEIVFLPDGRVLVTERPGRLNVIGCGGGVYEIEDVVHRGEGGLLGMAIHPDFEQNNWLYLYFTTQDETGTINRVQRYVLDKQGLSEMTIIIDGIPGANIHNGGRMSFGPDGLLYITTGDAGLPELAQDQDSLAGKILRLTDEGEVPQDNPFDSPVYTYGHRNPQGIAWDEQDRLWSTEHGATARDELNLIEAGNNYGWPVIEGMQEEENMETPMAYSGTDYTWAPSGAEFFDGSIFFAGLRGSSIYQAVIPEDLADDIVVKSHFKDDFGRMRTVKAGPDGMFYVLTSNRDGRGTPIQEDDRILRFDPGIF